MAEVRKNTVNGVTYDVAVATDTTLRKDGSPADAGAVGESLGDIESALDSIIALQNSLIGGES
jgi:hypothetical protein